MPPQQYRLLGIAQNKTGFQALLTNGTNQIIVRPGDHLADGTLIKTVDATNVTLQRDKELITLSLS
jgi:hypothetical protein